MTRGLYTAAAGMLASQAAQDAIAENLANASTTGYKQDVPQFISFRETLMRRLNGNASGPSVGMLGQGATLNALVPDLADGTMQQTGSAWDIALTGDAALAVQTPQGVRLSRDGALTRTAQGFLAQASGGALVLAQSGQPIRIPDKAKRIEIGTNGQVTADGASLGSLRLLSLTRGAVKVGDNQFTEASARPAVAEGAVHQGFLEGSNVSVVKEMVAMISVMRAYETDQKMAQAEDEATGHAVSEVGKV